MKLSTWIKKVGGPTAAGRLLNVSKHRVISWTRGRLPRPELMREIVTRSHGAVTYADLVHGAINSKPATRRAKRKAHKPRKSS